MESSKNTEDFLKQWQESLGQPEAPPDGIEKVLAEALEHPSEIDLVAAFVALKQEMGLHGRTVRDLVHKVDPMPDLIRNTVPPPDATLLLCCESTLKEIGNLRAQLQSKLVPAKSFTPQEFNDAVLLQTRVFEDRLIQSLLDVRDRLERGFVDATVRLKAIRGIRAWFTDKSVLEAVVDGLRLSLGRLDDLLSQLEVQPIPILQGQFDPHTMQAVETESRLDVADGQVLDVVRPGYRRYGKTLRYSEVKVNRRPHS